MTEEEFFFGVIIQKAKELYLSSMIWEVVAHSPDPGAHVLNTQLTCP